MIAPTAEPLLSIADPAAGLALLERTLNAEGKKDEAVVVSELRALAGDLDEREDRVAARAPARARSTRSSRRSTGPRSRPTSCRQRAATSCSRSQRRSPGSRGRSSARTSRRSASRRATGSRRAAATRRASCSIASRGSSGSRTSSSRLRRRRSGRACSPQDEPWIVVPPSFVKQPEPVQMAGLARAVARIAYGVPWLEEISPAQIEALLVAAARQVVKGYGVADASLVAQHEAALARALSRRQRGSSRSSRRTSRRRSRSRRRPTSSSRP